MYSVKNMYSVLVKYYCEDTTIFHFQNDKANQPYDK